MTRTVEINLLDQKLKLKTDSDEATVQSVVDYVSHRLEAIQQAGAGGVSVRMALLACLNIAEEFFRYKSVKEAKTVRVSNRITELMALIDNQRGALQPSLTGSDG